LGPSENTEPGRVMRILLVHNEYGKFSGEETIFYAAASLLKEKGHEVHLFLKRSADLPAGLRGQVQGFVSGIWSESVRREFRRALDDFRPDLVQIQNLYPLISASILADVKARGIPLVFAAHNYRLFCATGLMLRDGSPCSKCALTDDRWCVVHNCEGSLPRSIGYALRNAVTRKRLIEAADAMLVLSRFQGERFAEWGVPPERIFFLPNFVRGEVEPEEGPVGDGEYLAYAGRVSPEKGIGVLLKAAAVVPEIPIRIVGHTRNMPDAPRLAPPNVSFLGELPHEQMRAFYGNARATVIPSVWFETFGFVAVEAFQAGRPVIASRIGGLADIVEHEVNGLHVEAGHIASLANAMRRLWNDKNLCRRLGAAGREKVGREYSAEKYYERLSRIYTQLVSQHPSKKSPVGAGFLSAG
jgi:glycosyltransferase involved in cell wall biosynthesis